MNEQMNVSSQNPKPMTFAERQIKKKNIKRKKKKVVLILKVKKNCIIGSLFV